MPVGAIGSFVFLNYFYSFFFSIAKRKRKALLWFATSPSARLDLQAMYANVLNSLVGLLACSPATLTSRE